MDRRRPTPARHGVPAPRSGRRRTAPTARGSHTAPGPPGRKTTSRWSPERPRVRILARAPVPRHDLRLPDERSRQRADQGHARGARAGRGGHAGRGRRPRLQHLHDPREARPEVRGAPRAGRRGQATRPGQGDRRRRLLRGGAARAPVPALSVRRRRVRARDRSRISASGSAPAVSASHAGGSASTTAASPASCRCTANAASRPGCRSRWAATRRAPTASFRPCAGAR